MGPILHNYLYKLHGNISFLDDGETKFLFVARAGIRIKELYDLFCKYHRIDQTKHLDLFWASRFMLCKAYWKQNWNAVSSTVLREYEKASAPQLIKGIYKSEDSDILDEYNFENIKEIPAKQYIISINRGDAYTQSINEYLKEVNQSYSKYFNELTKGYKRVVLIDSGWQGTAHSILNKAHPDIDFVSLFFGVITTPITDESIIPDIKGMIFNTKIDDQYAVYEPKSPETAFTLHRHIIEELFEPNSGSVENIYFDEEQKKYIPKNYDELMNEELNEEEDFDYLGVLDYIKEDIEGTYHSPYHIHSSYSKAMLEMAQRIAYPLAEDVEWLGFMGRSMDFGRSKKVSTMVHDPADTLSPEIRIKRSLWSQGQIALEYANPEIAKAKQSERLQSMKEVKEKHNQVVGIITRTKNRPILFQRAADSVGNQTYKHYKWVVVNDGGELEPVQKIIDTCIVDKRNIILVHNPDSLGMEAASNAGVAAVECDYLIIHDDDDSWEPEFLEEAVGYLEGPKKGIYDGVVTGTTYISEEIKGDNVIIHGKKPYNAWLQSIQISEMACGNVFAPIAFLYRKEIYDRIGGYDESLPVLGDWDFNLRFMLHSNIGVLPKPLALYHHRDVNSKNNIYSNSVIGGISKHIEFEPVVRNKFLRMASQHGDFDHLGMLINMNFIFRDMRPRMKRIEDTVNRLDSLERQLAVISEKLGVQAKYLPATSGAQNGAAGPMIISKPSIVTRVRNGILGIFDKTDPAAKHFDNEAYMNHYPDVRVAVLSGQFRSAFEHYKKFGKLENRLEFLK